MAGKSATACWRCHWNWVKRFESMKKKGPSRVLIALTDGESNKGMDVMEAFALAKHFDVKVYTIGIGQQNSGMLGMLTNLINKPTSESDSC